MMNDTQIVDNTHFDFDDNERLICYTLLPDGDRFAQAVSSKEAVQKNMIGWCNTVREYLVAKESELENERQAAKRRRLAEDAIIREPTPSTQKDTSDDGGGSYNPKQLVLEHYDDLKSQRVTFIQIIDKTQGDLRRVEAEIEELRPVIAAWKGVKGES
jgi:hypothetical protein